MEKKKEKKVGILFILILLISPVLADLDSVNFQDTTWYSEKENTLIIEPLDENGNPIEVDTIDIIENREIYNKSTTKQGNKYLFSGYLKTTGADSLTLNITLKKDNIRLKQDIILKVEESSDLNSLKQITLDKIEKADNWIRDNKDLSTVIGISAFLFLFMLSVILYLIKH